MASDVLSKTAGTPDYTGQLILRTRMRITDRANGPSEAVPATSQDLDFSAPVGCVATPTSEVRTARSTPAPTRWFPASRGRESER